MFKQNIWENSKNITAYDLLPKEKKIIIIRIIKRKYTINDNRSKNHYWMNLILSIGSYISLLKLIIQPEGNSGI